MGRTNRQAARQQLEDFRQCGEEARACVLRQRKVDALVVEGVLHELLQTPLAGPTELLARVQRQLGRQDLRVATIESALEQISCVPVRRPLRRPLEAGQVHSQEAHVLDLDAGDPLGPTGPSRQLERAQRRLRDAEHRSHRPGRAGAPGSAARAGARLPLLADLPHDPVRLAGAALGPGPLVWRASDDHLTLGGWAGTGAVADARPVARGADPGQHGLDR